MALARPAVPFAPGLLAPIIGRDDDLDRALRLLLRDDMRLLTVAGPPGVGKTRLALALAERLPLAGVFVDLTPLDGAELVLPAIASALGVRERSAQPWLERLVEALAGRELVLVLDNLEHVLAAAVELGALLARCPRLRILATSREPLRLRCEQLYALAPLALPDLERTCSAATLAASPAVALFVERARSQQPTFVPNAMMAPEIALLCARLDGLPLAIELAAAQILVLSPTAMLARLEQQQPLLPWPARDLPARQATLEAAIAWSYDALCPAEQALFRRLSVFAGGWDLHAAGAACGDPEEATTGYAELLLRLRSLADKHLVTTVCGPDGQIRFGMLAVIRSFARAALDASSEGADVRQRHAEYFVQLAEQSEKALGGSGQLAWLARLDAEQGNLRAAFGVLCAMGTHEALARFTALCMYWGLRNRLDEAQRLITLPLGARSQLPDRLQAKLLSRAGALARDRDDLPAARALYAECLAVCRREGHQRNIAAALTNLANVLQDEGDLAGAEALFEESAASLLAIDQPLDYARALNNLGLVAYLRGRLRRARVQLQQSLTLRREHGDTLGIGRVLGNLALVELADGRTAAARKHFAESLRHVREVGWWHLAAKDLEGIARLALLADDDALALRFSAAADGLRARAGFVAAAVERQAAEQTARSARQRLGEVRSERVWAEGAALTADAAVDEALAYLNRSRGAPAAALAAQPKDGAALTQREREVLLLIAQGLSNKQVAASLTLSLATVSTHLVSIYGKLQVTSRTAAIVTAQRSGLL